MPASRNIARFNRRFLNRFALKVVRYLPWFGIVTHVGRKSGRMYRTPVNVFRTDDGYRVALTYGTESDWVKNVLAAGTCEIETRGQRVHLSHPRLETDARTRWAPLPVRFVLSRMNVPDSLRLSVS